MATLARRKTRRWTMEEFDRLFNELTRTMLRDIASWLSVWEDGKVARRPWAPAMDMFRKGDQLILRFDLPGVSPEALEVSVNEEGILTVRGERKWEEGKWMPSVASASMAPLSAPSNCPTVLTPSTLRRPTRMASWKFGCLTERHQHRPNDALK